MAFKGEIKTIKEDGKEKKILVATFTNGTMEQLEELKEFFKIPDVAEVVKVGISLLQKYKEDREKEK